MSGKVERFEDFVSSCVFMHDDTDSSAGVDWDQHGTNPFLLAPRACVIDTLEGFGEPYLDYLCNLGALPETLLVPKHANASLADSVIADQYTLHKLKQLIVTDQLDLSVFYADKDKERLMSTVSGKGEDGVSRIHPPRHAFMLANDKVQMHELLKKTQVPTPEAVVCSSVEDLRSFYGHISYRHSQILIKKRHWDTQIARSHEDISRLRKSLDFPVIAEVAYPVACSPVSHNLAWRGRIHHLFIVMQNVVGLRHAGNMTPTNLSVNLTRRIIEYSHLIIQQVPAFSGVFGVDFIVTTENQLLAVDVNPRFNSSTYPFYFLQRMGLDLNKTYAKYGFTECEIQNLSCLYQHKEFVPFSRARGEGILLYCPAFERSRGIVTKLSYLCVADSHEKLLHLESELQKISQSQNPELKGCRSKC